MTVRIKICCIASEDEARTAVRHGAAALGLVSEMPSGPGVIDEARIADIAAAAPPLVTTVLLTSCTDVDGIVAQQRRTGVNAVQLCAPVDAAVHRALRARLPGVGIIRVVHVAGPEAADEALSAAGSVDALLLDTGIREGPDRQLGGTGRTHDWSVSARIVAATEVPVLLAGGLRPDNVRAAIRAVRPYAVDVCSGVRAGGRLDEAALAAFVAAAREA